MYLSVTGRLPSIPEYYRDLIDNRVDLNADAKQCCPFHAEKTPSFSYSREQGKWRCFGACHCGGDVIDLHRKNYKLHTRKEAEESLCEMYHVDKTQVISNRGSYLDYVNEKRVHSQVLYNTAILKANTPDRWIQLDYVMSKYPTEDYSLQELLDLWDKKGE